MKLIWLPEARNDIQRLFDFLVEKDARAAERMIRAIQIGAQKLLEFPDMGRPMDNDDQLREWPIPFGAGAYVLRHRHHHDTIIVVRVWHSRENRH